MFLAIYIFEMNFAIVKHFLKWISIADCHTKRL